MDVKICPIRSLLVLAPSLSQFPCLGPLKVSLLNSKQVIQKVWVSLSMGCLSGEASIEAGKLTLPVYRHRDLEYLGTAGDASELVE